jgi:hypothetical protein
MNGPLLMETTTTTRGRKKKKTRVDNFGDKES